MSDNFDMKCLMQGFLPYQLGTYERKFVQSLHKANGPCEHLDSQPDCGDISVPDSQSTLLCWFLISEALDILFLVLLRAGPKIDTFTKDRFHRVLYLSNRVILSTTIGAIQKKPRCYTAN